MNNGICDFFFTILGILGAMAYFSLSLFNLSFFPVCTICSVLFSSLAIF